jgi:hypothetical protein
MVTGGIDWTEIGSGGRFEDIVGVLLSTLNPEIDRIDGSGGDGGRDYQLVSSDRLDYWQSKYFLGRLSDSRTRKTQIVNSLNTGAAAQPDSYTLLTPMIPTPEEREWFEGLQGDYPFPIKWKGGDWLDARLADAPSIVRHFAGHADKYVQLLRELKNEQEALVDGLPAARERIEELASRVDSSNPFYRLTFTVSDGRIVSIGLLPKYRGAEKDSPVTVTFNIVSAPERSSEDVARILRSALDWGDTVVLDSVHVQDLVIDAPHGLGGKIGSATIRVGAAEPDPVSLVANLTIKNQDGKRLASLPIYLTTRVRGARGITLSGQDTTGIVSVRMRLDLESGFFTVTFEFKPLRPLLPGALLPVLRFMAQANDPNVVALVMDGATAESMPLPPGAGIDKELVRLIEGLERLQSLTGVVFAVPTVWSAKDQVELGRTLRLLNGERVKLGTGPLTFGMQPGVDMSQVLEGGDVSLAIVASEPYIVELMGNEFDLGEYTIYVQWARFDTEKENPDADGKYHVIPVIGGVEVALGALTVPPAQSPVEE